MRTMPLLDSALSMSFVFLELLTVFLLALSFAPFKRSKRYGGVIILSLSLINYLEQQFVSRNGTTGTVFHTVFLLLILMLMILHLFQCRILKALAITLLASLYISAIDNLFMSVLFTFFTTEEQMGDQFTSYGFSLIAKLVEPGSIMLFYQWRNRHLPRREPDMTGWTLIFLFSIPAYLLVMALSRSIWFAPDAGWISLAISMLLSFVCVGAFFLLDYSGRRQEADRENTVLRQNLKLETAHIASMERRYIQQRQQTHDFKNQFAVLRGMAERNAPQEEFAAYLHSMMDIDIPSVLYINTHRTVVDIIMSEKYPMAKDKGIDFQFQLDDLTSFPMPDDALVVALTNLIDNAIEACEKIPQASDRHILLKMKMDERIALLGIENTTAEPVVIRDNVVQTTKNDTLDHGYGLRNVAAMIEQSGGMWFIEYRDEDKRFSFFASLPRAKE